MTVRGLLAVLALALAALPAPGQEGTARERVELRVTGKQAGGVVLIDRGARDGLAEGDRITFFPRRGGQFQGVVAKVDERNARVELLDRAVELPKGTRGEVRIPVERLAPEVIAPPTAVAPEHPPWATGDEEYTPDMPLLAQVDAVRPEARPRRLTGRTTLFGEHILTTERERSSGFYRLGTDLRYENPFDRGGELHFDAEANYRTTELPDEVDEAEGRLRVDRLSYAWGGTRFSDQRYQGGRFLQYGMPEFGVLDGFEWGRRLAGGHRVGASLGFMPEPDADFETGEDLQVSGYYEWVADERELVTAGAGYQKSWHSGAPDRDLFVGKFHYVPPEGWNFLTTAWIDLYTAADDARGSGLGLTQAYVSTGRRWDSGDSVNITYSHLEFPELLRTEFTPVTALQLADDHRERLAVTGWKEVSDNNRLHGQVGGWIDQDDEGGDVELGIEHTGLFARTARADATLFATAGKFTTVLGGRLSYGRSTPLGRWDLFYEFSNHDQLGFDEGNDDLPQHRLRGTTDLLGDSGWSLNLYGDIVVWDDEGGLTLGFFLQRSF